MVIYYEGTDCCKLIFNELLIINNGSGQSCFTQLTFYPKKKFTKKFLIFLKGHKLRGNNN